MSAVAEPALAGRTSHFQWSTIIGGAAVAAGVSVTLHAFAMGIGLSVVSAAPTWRDSSAVYWFLSGVYLLFVAIVSFAVGGYVAGRMRAPLNINTVEMEFRDGMHGLAMWGSAILATALLAFTVVAAATPAMVPPASNDGAAASPAGETIIASELDELFRSDRMPANIAYRRAEAARILLKSSSHDGISSEDHRYLAIITANSTGLTLDDANARVDREIAASTRELHRARVAAVVQAFFIAVALLVGAAVAWFAACEGGREREAGTLLFWDWSLHRRH